MGVMSCHRKNCDNIMCDTYVDDVGYVCWECQREFKEYMDGIKEPIETEGQILKTLKIFMDASRGEYSKGEIMNTDEFFNKYTKQ